MFVYVFLLFFFSSRRRHTRYIGDWSSDVCSSDLASRWPFRALSPKVLRESEWRLPLPRLVVKRIGFDVAQDPARQITRCKLRAGNKAHQRTKAPCRRSAEKVKPRDGALEAVIEFWITVDTRNGFEQRRGEKGIAGNVDPVTSGE